MWEGPNWSDRGAAGQSAHLRSINKARPAIRHWASVGSDLHKKKILLLLGIVIVRIRTTITMNFYPPVLGHNGTFSTVWWVKSSWTFFTDQSSIISPDFGLFNIGTIFFFFKIFLLFSCASGGLGSGFFCSFVPNWSQIIPSEISLVL